MLMPFLIGFIGILCFIELIFLFAVWAKLRLLLNNIAQNQSVNAFEQLTIRLDERDKLHHESCSELKEKLAKYFKENRDDQNAQRAVFDKHQFENLKSIIDTVQKSMAEIRNQITEVLVINTNTLREQFFKLTEETNSRLREISGQVEKRLTEGFEKTTATFTDIIKRLAIIDKAQERIAELSSNVVNLKEILVDKRSRGAFGEVQLNNLIGNMLPAGHFAFQHTLSNDKRADCILFLPEPAGKVVIDAKFPLENYQRFTDFSLPEIERQKSRQQFYNDIKKHIKDIAEKYIVAGETADFALMFIPAEAIFAEIHAHCAELVSNSHQARVWMVSPTTMMAILTTVSAVIKDEATRKQVNIIREHLQLLGKDFQLFQKRMDNLAQHIKQANDDVSDVHISAQKITSRFGKIEKVDFTNKENALLEGE